MADMEKSETNGEVPLGEFIAHVLRVLVGIGFAVATVIMAAKHGWVIDTFLTWGVSLALVRPR